MHDIIIIYYKNFEVSIMKKIISLLLVVFSLFSFSSCTQQVDVYKESMNITSIMELKASSEDFWQLNISGTPQSFEEERKIFMANDYDRPIRCYRISQPDPETVKQIFLFPEDGDKELFDSLPDALKEEYKNYNDTATLFSTVFQRVQFSSPSSHSMGLSICRTLRILPNAKIDAPVAYLYIFETGKPIAVLFTQKSDSEVSVQGYFLINSDYATLSATRDIFEPFGCTVEIEFDYKK